MENKGLCLMSPKVFDFTFNGLQCWTITKQKLVFWHGRKLFKSSNGRNEKFEKLSIDLADFM